MESTRFWGYMLHLGYNFWAEHKEPAIEYGDTAGSGAEDFLRCEKPAWDEITAFMAEKGANMLLIDLGEGIRYQSHPELAVKGSWEPAVLKKELQRLRSMGITPIPKLNFSTGHDEWMGVYSRQVSTPVYYEVCRDLIEEVVDLFDKPALFHLGMDEETLENQASYAYSTVRNGDLWWHDLYKNIETLERLNVRAWVWSDYIWKHEEEFLRKMPKTVVQSNWYYDTHFDWLDGDARMWVKPYETLEQHGYDQIPTGSIWLKSENFCQTVKYCSGTVAPERLLGFLQTPWKMTTQRYKYIHLAAVEEIAVAKRLYG